MKAAALIAEAHLVTQFFQRGGDAGAFQGGLQPGDAPAVGVMRSLDGLLRRHAVVEHAEDYLGDELNDARPSRGAGHEHRLAVLEHQGRRHAAAGAFSAHRPRVFQGGTAGFPAGFQPVGDGASPAVNAAHGEIGELVVEQKPAARHHHRAAEGLLDGGGHGHHVALTVHDGEMGGGAGFMGRRAARREPQRPRRGSGPHRHQRSRPIHRGRPPPGVGLVQQPGDGNMLKIRVGQEGAPVREGQPRRQHEAVDGHGRIRPSGGNGLGFHQVEQLKYRGRPGTGRPHPIERVAPVAAPHRPAEYRPVGGQVRQGHPARSDGSFPHGPGQLPADLTPVKRSAALAGQQAESAGQIGLAQPRPGLQGAAAGSEKHRPGGGKAPQPFLVAPQGFCQAAGNGKPLMGQADGGLEDARQRPGAIPLQGQFQHLEQPWHPHRQAAGDAVGEKRQGLAVRRQKIGQPGARREFFPAVDGHHPPGLGEIGHQEPPAADARGLRLDHVQHELGGHRRIDGIAPGLHHLHRGAGGMGVGGDGHGRGRADGKDYAQPVRPFRIGAGRGALRPGNGGRCGSATGQAHRRAHRGAHHQQQKRAHRQTVDDGFSIVKFHRFHLALDSIIRFFVSRALTSRFPTSGCIRHPRAEWPRW